MRKSIQAELDEFFGHLRQQASLVHEVSEQAFASARAKLADTALPYLNDWLLARAERDGRVARWHGLRLVAADATTVRFGLRASHVPRAAAADQVAFGLYLPGAEMMLVASLHSLHENERQMLFEHLDQLGAQDLLLLDRGYPCRWLPSLLAKRGISFCIRVEKTGNACVRDFLRSGLTAQVVELRAPDHADAVDYECDRQPTTGRLVRHVASNYKIRVLDNVRGFDEAITDPVRQLSPTEKGNVPDTWGDAALLRINKPIQNATYPGMNPGWSVRFPYGSIYDPVVKY